MPRSNLLFLVLAALCIPAPRWSQAQPATPAAAQPSTRPTANAAARAILGVPEDAEFKTSLFAPRT